MTQPELNEILLLRTFTRERQCIGVMSEAGIGPQAKLLLRFYFNAASCKYAADLFPYNEENILHNFSIPNL